MYQHFLLALLAILLPIVTIEGPQLHSKLDMGISGTYDVLVLAFLLPKEQVLQLLPASSQDHLLPVSEDVLSSLSSSSTSTAEQHPVLLQMGYQISTGPGPSWLPKFSFNECKLEVPFIRHPSGKSDAAYTLKQTMIFSNPVIKMGSSVTGLHSSTARFDPPTTPNHASKGEQEIRYTANGFVDATAIKAIEVASPDSWSMYKEMMESWWFGSGTGEVVQKFNIDWDHADIPPEAYNIKAEVNLAAFVDGQSDLKTVTVTGLGYRTRVGVASVASKAGQEQR